MFLTNLIRPFKKIKFRLTFIFTLTFLSIAVIFSYLFTRTFFNFTQQDFDNKLLADALNLSRQIENQSEGDVLDQLSLLDNKHFYTLRNATGEIIKSSSDKDKIPFENQFTNNSQYFFYDFALGEYNFRSVNLKFGNSKSGQKIIQLAESTQLIEEQKNRIFFINLSGIFIFVIISGLLSYINADRSLRPIKTITETVNSIASKNLSKRLPSFKMSEEFAELSSTFNGLLERLEKSFDAQEHFVANASHQLYTPLAIIKGELEVLQSKERTQEEYNKFHSSLKQELERMVDLVKNLLLISRIEAGHEESFKMRPLRLDDMMISTISRMKIKAKERQIAIKFNLDENLDVEELIINGERQLLSSLFENLIDNSIKYSPLESTIYVNIKKEKGILISVQDEGPGIKQNELKTILEKRFQRGTMTLMPGTGIGLSIAYKIAAHHKATIDYEKLMPQGSLFSVHFKLPHYSGDESVKSV